LRLDIFAEKGWLSLVRNEVELVLSAPATTSSVELLCTQLVRHPDPELLDALFDQLQRKPLPPTADTYQATLALFCAAGVNADWPALQAARNMLRQLSGSTFATLDLTEAFFRGQSAQRRLGSILPLLQPLSLDVTYALFDHYSGNQIAPAR
ncbi:MAG TPA: hypothetical protein VNW23_08210, partial [Opitutaceae bacterium]|nr:hypothetical protein [Opitutaceae bacterium]